MVLADPAIKRQGVVLCLPLALVALSSCRNGESLLRFQHPVTGRYGYVDTTGRVALPARYVNARDFRDGVAVVVEEHHIDCEYTTFAPFVINQKGRRVICRPEGASFSDASDGVILCRTLDGETLAFSTSGERLFSLDSSYEVDGFSEGRARVTKGQKVGYVDRCGKPVVQPIYTYGGTFRDGVAVVNRGGECSLPEEGTVGSIVGGDWFYIDRQGEVLHHWRE